MLVKSIKNHIKEVKNDLQFKNELLRAFGNENEGRLPLEIGEMYVVYGVSMMKKYPWYQICAQDGILYPWLYPAPFFEIIDNRLSRYWRFGYSAYYDDDGILIKIYTELNFEEWLTQNHFVDKLLNGNPRELSIFKKYRELMDLEFSNPSISKHASLLEGDWVMCSVCDESWSATAWDEMLRCPKCLSILQNPLSKK